jgi:hypothetical protein
MYYKFSVRNSQQPHEKLFVGSQQSTINNQPSTTLS